MIVTIDLTPIVFSEMERSVAAGGYRSCSDIFLVVRSSLPDAEIGTPIVLFDMERCVPAGGQVVNYWFRFNPVR